MLKQLKHVKMSMKGIRLSNFNCTQKIKEQTTSTRLYYILIVLNKIFFLVFN